MAARDLAPFFTPRSVAVVGAGDRPTSSGGAVLHMLRQAGFAGELRPINPKGGEMLGLRVFRSLKDMPGPAELCIIVIRPDAILEAAREAAATGHKHVLILPGGFAEAGPAGLERDRAVRALAASAGMTVAGPNCAGIVHLVDPRRRLGATFLRDLPPGPDAKGNSVALISQSGALAEEIIAKANEMRIPFGTIVSVGNAMHLGVAEYLEHLGGDDGISVVVLYIESVADRRRFRDVARRVAAKKPVVALIGGRTAPGGFAAKAHTGAAALDEDAAQGFADECCLVRVRSLRRMLLAARGFARYPRGIGKRVLILSNSGGPGVLCTDQCAAEGLELPALPAALAEHLRANLPDEASVANPLDLLADAREERFAMTLEAALGHGKGAFDAIVMIHVVPFMVDPLPVIDRLAAMAPRAHLPLLHSMMGTLPEKSRMFAQMEQAGVPMFNDIEQMAETAGILAQYPALRAKAALPPPGRFRA